MSTADIVERLRFARAYCSQHLPWFAPVLYSARILITNKVEVAAVDKHLNIYWNPESIAKICGSAESKAHEAQQLGFLWIHEISHILRDHADRCREQKADPRAWNIAADFEINDTEWEPLIMPTDFPGFMPQKYGLPVGEIAEWYYQNISIKEVEKSQGYGDEGSGVHSQDRAWEKEAENKEGDSWGQSKRQFMHPIDMELIKQQTAVEMDRNIQSGKMIDSISKSWLRWVKRMMKSKTSWQNLLHHRTSMAIALGVRGKTDYSFRRPNRRQSAYLPVLLPALTGSRTARIACVIDTSSSMDNENLAAALGEVFAILKTFNAPVTIIPCDTKAYDPVVLERTSDLFQVKKLAGGGGTDMTTGINAALALEPQPDTVLVLTDGFTTYPPKPYATMVIYGIICTERKSNIPIPPMPPWKENAVVWIERGFSNR